MRKGYMPIVLSLLITIVTFAFPLTSYAITDPPQGLPILKVGVESNESFRNFLCNESQGHIIVSSGTLPQDIDFVGDAGKYFSGTAAPGTVKSYPFTVTATCESAPANSWSGTLVVSKGPQTIVCDDQTVSFGTTVTLTPYSTDGNADPIDVKTANADFFGTDQALIDAHQPAYTFTSSTPAVATISVNTGEITPVSIGQTTITINSGETDSYLAATNDGLQVIITVTAVAPTITGPTSMTLTQGYAATSTGAYTITGIAPVTVTKTSGNANITWNDSMKKLDIAAGLGVGSYPVVLTASNGTNSDATLTFTLTVNAASTPDPAPNPNPGGVYYNNNPYAQKPTITQNTDGSVTLSVTAAGNSPLTYQWQVKGRGLTSPARPLPPIPTPASHQARNTPCAAS